METAAEEYQKSIESDSELLQNQTLDLETEASYFPEEFTEKLKSMKEGEVAYVDLPDSNKFYVIQKNSISKKCDEVLKDDDQRMSVVATMKNDEYSSDMEEGAKALDDITFNDSVLDSYDPKMFYSDSDLVSSTSSERQFTWPAEPWSWMETMGFTSSSQRARTTLLARFCISALARCTAFSSIPDE